VGTRRLEFWHHHAGISVPDLDRAIEWYNTVLGFEVEARFPIDVIPAKVVMLKNGPLHIELFEVPGAVPASAERGIPERDLYTHGNKHVSFAVESVKQLAEELRRRGADIVWVREMEQGANLFMRDLYGNLIEFIQGRRPQETAGSLTID
jgi:methylmalonyl-CoA/ethylmalonyl-CoA epimerase